eukprot:GILI01012576.1.p1 GENE.GILI01012576.1~~GILI01012576.1.p1  ORF type:complete len:582 (-),score=172.06 GILI01012576.1:84-1829(-)
MDVYRQASEVVGLVLGGQGTAKSLCLRKEMQKKRQTYAVVCESIRHYHLLLDVLDKAQYFQFYPKHDKNLAVVLAYDAVIGKGIRTKQNQVAVGIVESTEYLKKAYAQVKHRHTIAPSTHRKDDAAFDDAEKAEGGKGKTNRRGHNQPPAVDGEFALPKYARVNTLLTTMEEAMTILDKRFVKQAREQLGEDATQDDVDVAVDGLREFGVDADIPCLLKFPHLTNIQAHPLVKYGKLVIQDKASCMPPCVMLGAVKVVLSDKIAAYRKEHNLDKIEYVIDACAAPGNKTTQLAALGKDHGIKLMAIERDVERAAMLQRRVDQLGAKDLISVFNMDFFKMASADRDAAEAILLDPSCSASGVVSRSDLALASEFRKQQSHLEKAKEAAGQKRPRDDEEEVEGADEVEEDTRDPETKRVERLSIVQKKLLTHSLLSFSNCRRVVYSTCSINEAENEGVVRQVLEDERIVAAGWELSQIMPSWPTRGWKAEGSDIPTDYTIRCDPNTDETNGFYVACFDRIVPSAEEKKKAEKAAKKKAGSTKIADSDDEAEATEEADEAEGEGDVEGEVEEEAIGYDNEGDEE